MASNKQSGNEQMVQLITQQNLDFLTTLKDDISNTKSLTENDRRNCEAVHQRASIEYNRLKMQFLRETLVLINQALETLDREKLEEIHLAWSFKLDQVTRQCEQIANPLIDVARIVSKSDEQMGKKYWYCFGSAMVSFLLIGTAYGFFIACCFPTSLVSLLSKGILGMGVGVVVASGIAANCKRIPALNCDGQTNDTSTSELTMKLKQSIATLNITKDMWHNRENLQSIKETAEVQLRNLENST